MELHEVGLVFLAKLTTLCYTTLCHTTLCNSWDITRTMIGRNTCVIREQTHEWRHNSHFERLARAHLLRKRQRKIFFVHNYYIKESTSRAYVFVLTTFWRHLCIYKSTDARKNGIYFLITQHSHNTVQSIVLPPWQAQRWMRQRINVCEWGNWSTGAPSYFAWYGFMYS